jgi:lipoprotein-anchoring transpeptidase ErfK/SrfK
MEDRVAALLRDGQAAARAGKRAVARRKFRAALVLAPVNVTALLWLAWLSDDPRASLAYIARVLAYAPDNPRAHAALRWARRRAHPPVSQHRPSLPAPAAPVRHRWWNRAAAAVVLALLVVLVGGVLAWFPPDGLPVLAALVASPSPIPAVMASPAPTDTPVPTPTATRTAIPTPTATSTITPTGTPTHSLTVSPSPSVTATPGSALPTAPPFPPTVTLAPSSIRSNVRWIDVDLTHQTLTAYEGQTPVRTTFVSTGLPRTPTPVGRYHIWIKLRYDNMSGPGYYLRNVPYVMYFYGGYGLHGTYWHSNFGHPMSHGCVNLPTAEAEWLFNWADVGTLVNVHH